MARRHLVELAEDCQRAWDYIERQMLEQYERLVYRDGDTFCFSVDEWKQVDPYLQGQLLMHIMEQVCGSRKDIGRVHVDALLRWQKARPANGWIFHITCEQAKIMTRYGSGLTCSPMCIAIR